MSTVDRVDTVAELVMDPEVSPADPRSLLPADEGPGPAAEHSPGHWNLGELRGRLSELTTDGSGAPLSTALALVLEAQLCGEPAAWVTVAGSCFFPPDVAALGVDLEALPVVRAPDASRAARGADKLLRSGSFGLVVVDLVELGSKARVAVPLQSRLLGLSRKHDAALVFLTGKDPSSPSLGPLVSLRVGSFRKRRSAGRFECEIHATKDKRRGPGWYHRELRHGPPGLR